MGRRGRRRDLKIKWTQITKVVFFERGKNYFSLLQINVSGWFENEEKIKN